MEKSFKIRNGRVSALVQEPPPLPSTNVCEIEDEDNDDDERELLIPSIDFEKARYIPLEQKLASEVSDKDFSTYLSATSNQLSCIDDPSTWNVSDICVDEAEDHSLFSNKVESQFLNVLDKQEEEFDQFPSFHQFCRSSNNTTIQPNFNDYNKAFFHASNILDPVDENTAFFREMVQKKKNNIFDPNHHVHYLLCEEWVRRNELGLRNIYFSTLPKDQPITVNMAIPLFTRYHGRDSIIMRMECTEWPLYFSDPTGIKTFKDCIRPPWLLDYIYTVMLSSVKNREEHFNQINILESPHLWNNHVRMILLSTNLPVALLHPVELETEEGNYFPVTPKEFSDWLLTNNF